MTVSGDFIPEENLEGGASNPVVFGMEITPNVGGVLLGVLGAGVAAYLFFNLVQPAWQEYQQLKTSVEEKEIQVEQQQANIKKIEDANAALAQAQQEKASVLAMFGDDSAIDTLALDINRQVEASRATLKNFSPESGGSKVVTDPSFGEGVQGKLKALNVNLQMEGSFNQLQSVMRNIERLQPVILTPEFTAQVDPATQKIVLNSQGRVISQPEPKLNTTLNLKVLTPLSQEELAEQAAAAQPAPAQ